LATMTLFLLQNFWDTTNSYATPANTTQGELHLPVLAD
jgi:hypothetical protein